MILMSLAKHLAKGRACIDCRRRKVKCGGEIPACKRCVRGGYGLDCQYVDERGKTGVQLLEASITKFEARLAELQSLATQKQPVLEIYVPGRGGLCQNVSDLYFRLVPPRHAMRPATSLPAGWWEQSRMPLEVTNLLMDHFAPYAFQLGFFMHGPRLCHIIFRQSNFPPPSPNLLNVIYLWGIHLSGDDRLLAYESLFLNRAVQFDLSAQQPQHVVHNIQADILLAAFFLRFGKHSSAIHRLNSAVSLCISYGLHRQASNQSAFALHLPPPRDSIDRGERLDAFWTTFLLCKALDVQEHASFRILATMDEFIDTPFPLEMSFYEGGSVPSNPNGVLTLKSFLKSPGADPSNGILALTAKAAALFERAKYYSAQWQLVQHPEERKFEMDLLYFTKAVPPLSQFVGPYTKYTWITVMTLLQVAIIHLHGSRKYHDSNQKCLDAAQTAANLIASFDDQKTVQHIHPIMAPLWFTVCETLIDGILESHIKDFMVGTNEHLIQSLTTVVQAMETCSRNCYEMTEAHLLRLNGMFHRISFKLTL
ncbi:hypothetical protein J3R30DRAFT_1760982 [Lentinula aciculospora]|uniref:Zn(2)-C6 fungal-type domain-containing protein n=1 Tax=Lentinula aciculospora TaxID=153920 RepID=A0A9W9DSP5_9AGAR|nr:hypothetical protein J3R30DRAFT_1760982 [Lentinula aciculospora]